MLLPSRQYEIEQSVRDRIERNRAEVTAAGLTPAFMALTRAERARRAADDQEIADALCRLTHRSVMGPLTSLWCAKGHHVWHRLRQRGRPAPSCPEHA